MSKDDLDAMFGVTIVPFAEGVSVKVRRVLSRGQQRTLSDVEVAHSRLLGKMQKLSTDAIESDRAATAVERANKDAIDSGEKAVPVPERMSDLAQEEAARGFEDELANDLVRGCNAMLTDTEALMLDTWSISSLGQLFRFAKDVTGKSLTEALTGAFPQNGSRG